VKLTIQLYLVPRLIFNEAIPPLTYTPSLRRQEKLYSKNYEAHRYVRFFVLPYFHIHIYSLLTKLRITSVYSLWWKVPADFNHKSSGSYLKQNKKRLLALATRILQVDSPKYKLTKYATE